MADTTENNVSVENAVEQAVQNLPNDTVLKVDENASTAEESTTVETQTETTTEEATANAETTETPVETSGEDAAELEKARNVYKLLNDPKTAPGVIKMLAEQLGLLGNATVETARQPQLADLIAQELGEEYGFLAPKISKAMEVAIKHTVTPIQQELQQTKAATEFQTAITKVNEQTKGDFGKFEKQIVELMDVMKPAPGVPVDVYLNNLYRIAKGAAGPPPPAQQVRKVVQQMEKNAKAALPSPSAATENRVVKGPALPSVEECVLAAIRGEQFE